jgi:hypothetical protein
VDVPENSLVNARLQQMRPPNRKIPKDDVNNAGSVLRQGGSEFSFPSIKEEPGDPMKDKNVLLVDCDPQCNLTGMVLGLEDLETSESIQGAKNGKPLNIREGLAPAFESRPILMKPVECISIPRNDNLFLLPGHIGLAEYEVTLGIAQELSGSLVTLRNLPGSLRYLIDVTAREYDIDIVIIDMSPSLGAVNQNLLSISDYFIIPMHPDYFSSCRHLSGRPLCTERLAGRDTRAAGIGRRWPECCLHNAWQ